MDEGRCVPEAIEQFAQQLYQGVTTAEGFEGQHRQQRRLVIGHQVDGVMLQMCGQEEGV